MPLASRIPLISFQSIMAENLPTVDWLVTDLIANLDRVMFYGEFVALKTWLLLSLAIAIASGRDWLGTFRTPTPKKVLYVDEEMNERMLEASDQTAGIRGSGW
jgi:RecA-family ATPase